VSSGPKDPRLLIYSQDGRGLGHLRRTSSIAGAFLAARPEACVLTVSDSPLGTFFGMADRHDYLKLPSLVKHGPGRWEPLSLPISRHEVISLRRNLLRTVVTDFRPDVLLVDHMPHGAQGELLPTLEALRGTSTKVVLGLRDILDAPHVTRRVWRDEGAYKAVEDHYDLVLVYGNQEVFDVAREYRWTPHAAGLVEYCGYLSAPLRESTDKHLRSRSLAGDGRLVVAMAGGGADAYPVMLALLEGFKEIRATTPCALILVTGPFMPADQRRDIELRARDLPVQVRTSVKNVASYLTAADVVVGMAGYNTIVEVLRMETPAVIVPRAGPSAEQGIRARLFADRGWVHVVDPHDLSPSTIADGVLRALAPGAAPVEKPDLGGLDVAVGHLVGLLDKSAQPSRALLGV
jgi:predicted glycosyltransferase